VTQGVGVATTHTRVPPAEHEAWLPPTERDYQPLSLMATTTYYLQATASLLQTLELTRLAVRNLNMKPSCDTQGVGVATTPPGCGYHPRVMAIMLPPVGGARNVVFTYNEHFNHSHGLANIKESI